MAFLYVLMLTHSTSPKVAQPALTMPQRPEEVEMRLALTNDNASSQSFCFVMSSCRTCSLGLPSFLSSVAPGPSLSASRQPANTLKPSPARCFAKESPKPVSHPVMRTDLSPTSSCKEDLRKAKHR